MAVIELLQEKNRGLRVSFTRHNDRYAHTITMLGGTQELPILSSLEGTNADAWPPSPPFQELRLEERDGMPVALLIGMAGKSHWSAAIEVTHNAIQFDVACRIKERPSQLGTTYQLLVEGHVPEDKAVFRAKGLDGSVLLASEESLRIQDERLHFQPRWNEDLPATIRWKYSVSLVDAG